MLEKQREEIDKIDSELIELLKRRMIVVNEIIDIKLENDIPVFDEAREEKQKAKINNKLGDSIYKKYILSVFETILKESKEYQRNKILKH